MEIAETVRVTLHCPSFDTANELTLVRIHDAQLVACSHCGKSLGTVKDILQANEKDRGEGSRVLGR